MISRAVYKQRRGRKAFTALAVVSLLTGVLAISANVLAVSNTGAFELDGDATSATGNAGTGADDWDRVCREIVQSDCSTTATTQTADPKSTARTWVDATVSPTIFTGGGSKDPQDISSWLWKPKDTVPDKDTLRHAFAARYSLPPDPQTCPVPTGATSCEVIFFGMDRFANDGDAQLGFWFFQDAVTLSNTPSQGGFKFNGVHRDGDLLLISDFSNGGTTATISAYFWDTSCTKADNNNPQAGQCAAANLRLQAKSDDAKCSPSAPTAPFCGIVNPTDGTTAPWPYTDKKGNSTYLQGEFYEGGVNLSGLGIGDECFSAIAAESRASTSPTSVLKDFVLGGFGECGSGVVTTPQTGAGASIPSAGISIGTSARVDVRDQAVITVTGTQTFGGAVKFFLCGPLALTSTSNCQTGGVQIGSPTTGETVTGAAGTATVNSDTATLTSAGRYCWRAEYTGDTSKGVPGSSDPIDGTTVSECFKVNPVTPTLTTQASGNTALGNAISDTATLSGTAKQPGTDGIGPGGTINATAASQAAAGGSITWRALGPDDCTTVAMAATSRTVSGDGIYPTASQTAVSFTPTAIGTYTFVAGYGGNSPNTNSVAESACPDTTGTETVTVTGSAALSTAQDWLPNDTATLTGPVNLNGTLTFQLYTGDNCGATSGSAVSGQQYTVTVTNAASGSTFSTSNTTFKVSASASYSWLVTYDDTTLNDPAPKCEKTSLTITN